MMNIHEEEVTKIKTTTKRDLSKSVRVKQSLEGAGVGGFSTFDGIPSKLLWCLHLPSNHSWSKILYCISHFLTLLVYTLAKQTCLMLTVVLVFSRTMTEEVPHNNRRFVSGWKSSTPRTLSKSMTGPWGGPNKSCTGACSEPYQRTRSLPTTDSTPPKAWGEASEGARVHSQHAGEGAKDYSRLW